MPGTLSAKRTNLSSMLGQWRGPTPMISPLYMRGLVQISPDDLGGLRRGAESSSATLVRYQAPSTMRRSPDCSTWNISSGPRSVMECKQRQLSVTFHRFLHFAKIDAATEQSRRRPGFQPLQLDSGLGQACGQTFGAKNRLNGHLHFCFGRYASVHAKTSQ